MKNILSAVPAPKENPQSGKDLGRALPIEFVELSRTESYRYRMTVLLTVWWTGVRKSDWRRDESAVETVALHRVTVSWAADAANVFGAPKRRVDRCQRKVESSAFVWRFEAHGTLTTSAAGSRTQRRCKAETTRVVSESNRHKTS
jgi:hypothetical protein